MASKEVNSKIRFRRIRGRIVPIKVRNELSAIKGISKSKMSLAKIAGVTTAGLGGLAIAGRLGKISTSSKIFSKKIRVLNKFAKLLKFSSKAIPAIVIAKEVTKIDAATKADEKSQFLNLGKKNIALGLVGGFALSRVGKRFERFGQLGFKNFPFKLKDI